MVWYHGTMFLLPPPILPGLPFTTGDTAVHVSAEGGPAGAADEGDGAVWPGGAQGGV